MRVLVKKGDIFSKGATELSCDEYGFFRNPEYGFKAPTVKLGLRKMMTKNMIYGEGYIILDLEKMKLYMTSMRQSYKQQKNDWILGQRN